MKSVEIFAGAGGMAMGISAAGFDHLAVIERDEYACDTLMKNEQTKHWPIINSDVVKPKVHISLTILIGSVIIPSIKLTKSVPWALTLDRILLTNNLRLKLGNLSDVNLLA